MRWKPGYTNKRKEYWPYYLRGYYYLTSFYKKYIIKLFAVQ